MVSWFRRSEPEPDVARASQFMEQGALGVDVWCPSERATGNGTSIRRSDNHLNIGNVPVLDGENSCCPKLVNLCMIGSLLDKFDIMMRLCGLKVPNCCFRLCGLLNANDGIDDLGLDDEDDFDAFDELYKKRVSEQECVTWNAVQNKAWEQLQLALPGEAETISQKLRRLFYLPIVLQRLRVQYLPPTFSMALQLTRSIKFECVVGILIMLSAIMTGVGSNYRIQERPGYFDLCEHIFTTVFLIEWLIRVAAGTWVWLFNCNNIFDTLLIWGPGVLYFWVLKPMDLAKDTGVLHKLGCLRILRIARLIRCVRMIPFFRDLWVLVKGVTDSLSLLVWSWVIIGSVHFMFAVIVVEVIAKDERFKTDEYVNQQVQELFGSIPKAMFTLFQMMTFDNWSRFVRPMYKTLPACMLIFGPFMGLAGIMLFNLVLAVVVKNATDATLDDVELQAIVKTQQQQLFVSRLATMFKDLDENGDGTLSLEEFTDVLDDVSFIRTMKVLDIDLEDLPDIFEILDDGDQSISTDEFITGIMKMQGPAQNRDVLKAARQMKCCKHELNGSLGVMEKSVFRVAEDIQSNLDNAHWDMHQAMQMVAEILQKSDEVGIRSVVSACMPDLPEAPPCDLTTVDAARRAHEEHEREAARSPTGGRQRRRNRQGSKVGKDRRPSFVDMSASCRPPLPPSFIHTHQKEQRQQMRRLPRKGKPHQTRPETPTQELPLMEALLPDDYADMFNNMKIMAEAPEKLRATAKAKLGSKEGEAPPLPLVPFALSGPRVDLVARGITTILPTLPALEGANAVPDKPPPVLPLDVPHHPHAVLFESEVEGVSTGCFDI